MNHLTRFQVSGRALPAPCKIRHGYRLFFLPPFGPVAVAWSVAAGLYVGDMVSSRDILYIVPLRPRHFPDAPLHLYSGPRPYWFYFYVQGE